MSYSRDEVKADHRQGAEHGQGRRRRGRFSGGERSATRFANSSITANLIEHDQEVRITVYYGQKSASATTHQFDDASLKRRSRRCRSWRKRKPDNPELMPPVKPPQPYVEVDAALPGP
jgi:predicted Zn-dependent protease